MAGTLKTSLISCLQPGVCLSKKIILLSGDMSSKAKKSTKFKTKFSAVLIYQVPMIHTAFIKKKIDYRLPENYFWAASLTLPYPILSGFHAFVF